MLIFAATTSSSFFFFFYFFFFMCLFMSQEFWTRALRLLHRSWCIFMPLQHRTQAWHWYCSDFTSFMSTNTLFDVTPCIRKDSQNSKGMVLVCTIEAWVEPKTAKNQHKSLALFPNNLYFSEQWCILRHAHKDLKCKCREMAYDDLWFDSIKQLTLNLFLKNARITRLIVETNCEAAKFWEHQADQTSS